MKKKLTLILSTFLIGVSTISLAAVTTVPIELVAKNQNINDTLLVTFSVAGDSVVKATSWQGSASAGTLDINPMGFILQNLYGDSLSDTINFTYTATLTGDETGTLTVNCPITITKLPKAIPTIQKIDPPYDKAVSSDGKYTCELKTDTDPNNYYPIITVNCTN